MKALAGTSWGADERTLRDLYVGSARPAGFLVPVLSLLTLRPPGSSLALQLDPTQQLLAERLV